METITYIPESHEAGIRSLALSRDGTMVAAGTIEGVVRVFTTEDGELIAEFPLGDAEISGLDFVNGDRNLLLAPNPGPLRIVILDNSELLDAARSRLTRGFAPQECVEFLIDPCPTLEEKRAS